MKKIIATIVLMLVILSTQPLEKHVKSEKVDKYGYRQGLAISLDISTCILKDEGINKFARKTLDRFEEETGSRNFNIMLLTIGIAQEYGLDLEKEFIPEDYGDYIKKVSSNCKRVAEFDHRKK